MDMTFYSNEDLEKTRVELTKAREEYASAKLLYNTMKDKRTLFVDKIIYKIAAREEISVARAKGMVLDDKEYADFQEGYLAARQYYENIAVQKDNLEKKWETVRTILAQNRKERWNQIDS